MGPTNIDLSGLLTNNLAGKKFVTDDEAKQDVTS